jgi:hypothetical protein
MNATPLADLLRQSIALVQQQTPDEPDTTKGTRIVTDTETIAPAPDLHALAAALAAPFPEAEIRWLPGVVSGNRALALPYISNRAVQDRLDAVVGMENWRDDYQPLPSGSIVCTLSLRIAGEWIGKSDVGSPSEQPDEGDRVKAAFTDALKRAAVKFGIARYLYGLPKQWADYDPQKKQFVNKPRLPASALPKPSANGTPANGTNGTPANGTPADDSFKYRLVTFDTKLVGAGLAMPGQCYQHVQNEMTKNGAAFDPAAWNAAQQTVAMGLARSFEADRRKAQPAKGR